MTHLQLSLPGGWLMLLPEAGLSPAARDQLETWSLVAADDQPDDDPSRSDPSVWTQALAAGPLVVAAVYGVVGNAAWSMFPAAAHYLRALRVGRPGLDAGGAAARARAAVAEVCGVSVDDVAVDSMVREATGAWTATVRISGERTLAVVLDAAGSAVAVQPA